MTAGPSGAETARWWLAARVRGLWESAGADVQLACQEFDRLVVEHGRVRMAVALSDAGLCPVIGPSANPVGPEAAGAPSP